MEFLFKYIKVISALCLIFTLMCPIFLHTRGTESTPFVDISPDDWHYQYVKRMSEEGIIQGMTPTTFEPGGTLTVAQLSALVCRYLGLEAKALMLTDGIWYSGYEALMKSLDILPSDIDINKPVRRDDAAEIIIRSFSVNCDFIVGGGYDDDSLSAFASQISDYENIPENKREYVAKAYYNGIFNGYEDGSFHPDGHLTRAEAAKIITVITDYSQRELCEYRDLPPTAQVTAQNWLTDPLGQSKLNSEKLADLLWQLSTGLEFTDTHINLTLQNIIPAGYVPCVQLYALENGVYDAFFTFDTDRFPAQISQYAEGERSVLIYLRNATADGRVDAIAEFRADKTGKIYFSEYEMR